MKKRTFIFLCTLISIMQIGSAYAYEPSQAGAYYIAFKKDVERLIGGESIDEKRKKLICSMTAAGGQMFRQEQGKLEYNNLFHELQGDEQANDIKKLKETLSSVENCEKNVRLWNAYDEKWYAESRARQVAEKEMREKAWATQIKDTGADVLDGVINGTFFSIPRSHIWFDRNRADGQYDGVNIIMYYPSLEARPSGEMPYGERSDIRGVLKPGVSEVHPCGEGFPKGYICKRGSFQNRFAARYLKCIVHENGKKVTAYKGRWRKACEYQEGLKAGYQPVYDEDVGLMRIGEKGYYEGEPEFPEYWVQCAKIPKSKDEPYEEERELCTSAFQINEGVFFYYTFPQRMFWEHRKIHDALKAKIHSWIVQSE